MVSESDWLDRVSRRIEAWPVGPVAASMLGAATGFFCWAMPYSPMIGRIALIVAPALLAFVLTLAVFRWIDAHGAVTVVDEGDDHEDWLTFAKRRRAAAAAFNIVQDDREAPRPVIIDAADAHERHGTVRDGGWPLPLVEPVAKAQARSVTPEGFAMPASHVAASFDTEEEDDGAAQWDEDDWDDQELLLDAPLFPAGGDADRVIEDRPEMSIEEMMACLAQRIDGRQPVGGDRLLKRARPTSTTQGPPKISDEDALRAALADLHRMAAKR